MLFVSIIELDIIKQALCHFEKDLQVISQSTEMTMHSENELAIVGESCFEFSVPIWVKWDTAGHNETQWDITAVYEKRFERGWCGTRYGLHRKI